MRPAGPPNGQLCSLTNIPRNPIENFMLPKHKLNHTDYLLINMELSGEKNQITGDLMQHLPFPFRDFEKSNLKFSSVGFYLHLESEIIFSWKVPFFLYFPLPSDMILDTLLGFSSLQTLPAWHHLGLVCSWLRKCLHGLSQRQQHLKSEWQHMLIPAGNPANWQ